MAGDAGHRPRCDLTCSRWPSSCGCSCSAPTSPPNGSATRSRHPVCLRWWPTGSSSPRRAERCRAALDIRRADSDGARDFLVVLGSGQPPARAGPVHRALDLGTGSESRLCTWTGTARSRGDGHQRARPCPGRGDGAAQRHVVGSAEWQPLRAGAPIRRSWSARVITTTSIATPAWREMRCPRS